MQAGGALSTTTTKPTTTRCEKFADGPSRLAGFTALAIVKGGLQLAFVDGERVRLVEGDALLVAPGASCIARARTTPCEVLRLEADPAWTEAMLHLSSGAPPGERTGGVNVLRAASPAARRVRQILRELMLPRPSEEEPSSLHRTRAVIELLALAADAGVSETPPVGPSQAGAATRSAFLAAVAELDENDERIAISLSVFAEELGLSERQVSRLFRLELDTTFCAYMTKLRVGHARRLLEASELPVIQIAAETGWSSLAHFNSVFRRLTGCTPTAYRASAARPQ